jgi:flagellar basal-body rod modification protein FlgD
MSSYNPVAPVPTTGTGTATPKVIAEGDTNPGAVMDKDGFLKLLVGQLRQQDPMNATGSEELMAQMTQLSMLEQVTNLTKANEKLTTNMATSQALGLIGHTVSYTKEDGTSAEGVVEKVELEDGKATLTVAGQAGIDPAEVLEVS